MLVSEQEKSNKGFGYTGFTNDSGNPVNSDFLNKLQEYIEALNKAGLTQAQILNLIKNNSASKEYVDGYQQPWDVEENVGDILVHSPAEITAKGYSNSNSPRSEIATFSFESINSGKFYLDATLGLSDQGYVAGYYVRIYKNNVLLNAYNNFTSSYTPITLETTVNKGDKIKFELYAASRENPYTSSDYVTTVSVSDIMLRANIDTPYKYINLPITKE